MGYLKSHVCKYSLVVVVLAGKTCLSTVTCATFDDMLASTQFNGRVACVIRTTVLSIIGFRFFTRFLFRFCSAADSTC